MDIAALQTAATAALDKLSKPSWRSPTWWICTVIPVAASIVLLILSVPATSMASVIVTGVIGVAGIVAGSWKDGVIKTAIAAAPAVWELARDIHHAKTGTELVKLTKPPYSSSAPPHLEPSVAVPGTMIVVDDDEPKGGKGDKK